MKFVSFFLLIGFFLIDVNASGDATLKNIKINDQPCECVEYVCEMEVFKDDVVITYELSSEEATVDRESGLSVTLTSNVTNIDVEVKNGENNNIYHFIITKHVKSDDYTLSKLLLNNEEITLMEDVFVYNAAVPFDEENVIIEAVPTDSKASVDKELSFLFPTSESSKSFDFKVTSESGTEKNYRIFVTRKERPDTTLKSLKLDQGKIEFNKDIFEYSIDVEYSVTDILIEALPNDSEASVKVVKEELSVGENIITITVNNQDVESIYTLIINREPNLDKSQANLESLKVTEYSKLNFDSNVLEYDLFFESIPSILTIEAKAINNESDIEIIDNNNLTIDSVVTVKVTLEQDEHEIVRVYRLNIKKIEEEKNNKMAIIVAIVLLVIAIIVLLILQIRDRKKNNRKNEISIKKEVKNTIKKEEVKKEIIDNEEEIEII